MLRWLAKAYMRELFTAAALFIVIGVAWLMEQVGISAALGTFIAGLMLANSEFRHELETDIEPFKGVLLGLFFTAVGSTINFELIAASALPLFSFVLGLMLLKGLYFTPLAGYSNCGSTSNCSLPYCSVRWVNSPSFCSLPLVNTAFWTKGKSTFSWQR